MATFAPPPPPPRPLVTVVAPYAADASQRRSWERRQERHHRALGAVQKTTDQSEPATSTDHSLLRARERSRAFATDDRCREIGEANRKLLDNLSEIVQKPSAISRLISGAGQRPQVPRRGVEAEKKRQKEIAYENELLVKRLLAVRTSFDRRGNERDFRRHQQDLERLNKFSGPRTKRLEARKLPQLPGAAAFGATALPGGGPAGDGRGLSASDGSSAKDRTVVQPPPLPHRLVASSSLPALLAGPAPPPGGAPALAAGAASPAPVAAWWRGSVRGGGRPEAARAAVAPASSKEAPPPAPALAVPPGPPGPAGPPRPPATAGYGGEGPVRGEGLGAAAEAAEAPLAAARGITARAAGGVLEPAWEGGDAAPDAAEVETEAAAEGPRAGESSSWAPLSSELLARHGASAAEPAGCAGDAGWEAEGVVAMFRHSLVSWTTSWTKDARSVRSERSASFHSTGAPSSRGEAAEGPAPAEAAAEAGPSPPESPRAAAASEPPRGGRRGGPGL